MSKTQLPKTMTGVLLTEHGGLDKLHYRTDIKMPTPAKGEVLIKIAASAINNTDINTRIGWYSKKVTADTSAGGAGGFKNGVDDDASWSGAALVLPRIQGADCCGEIVAVGDQVSTTRLGQRVLVRPMQESVNDQQPFTCTTFGSEFDGAFAQYATVRASEVYHVSSELSSEQLASFPCAYSTAENMLERANVKAGETVLITGASGGVGSAAIQLAKRRKAFVIAVCSAAKVELVKSVGADKVISRDQNLLIELGESSIDVVVDLVAGDEWSQLLLILRRGGRYAVAGAIAGPIVKMDVRDLYLKDLSFFGCTYQPKEVFENLIGYIEQGEIKPVVAAQYNLKEITQAQQKFLEKDFIGKIVMIHDH